MKKKIFSIFISCCTILSVMFPLVACSKDDTPATISSLKMGYLENLTAEIGDATALGIQSFEKGEISSDVSTDSNYDLSIENMLFDGSFNEIASSVGSDKKSSKKNYLVKYTDEYDGSDVDVSKGGISKVKFKKTKDTNEKVYDENGKLIKDNQSVDQDNISAQINKVYVLGNFTFIQFIPTEDVLKKFADRVTEYNKD